MVSVVNVHSSELRSIREAVAEIRGLVTEILQHTRDIPSLFVLLPAKQTMVSRLRNPFKAMFSSEMRLFAVCPVTLKAVLCGPEGAGWTVRLSSF